MPALPREVFFEVMRSQFRITFKELCDCILSNEHIGGLSARERGRDAARRNREFIHVAPGADDAYWQLAAPEEYVPNLFDRIQSILGSKNVVPMLIDVLSGIGAEALRTALDNCGLNGSIYTNLVNYICDGDQSDKTTAALLLHLYVATAITGDPEKSAAEVIKKAYSIDYDQMTTSTPPIQACDPAPLGGERLALMRLNGIAVYPSRTYPLSLTPEGTKVGSILLDADDITDVERGVSRSHLRIWRDENGEWWCKGLNSLNGTVLVDHTSGKRIVVEPPRSERPADYEPVPHPIKLADHLVLAEYTEFIVVLVPNK